MKQRMDRPHDEWTIPHNKWIVPLYGRIIATRTQRRWMSRPRGARLALSGLQGVLNGNNLHSTVNYS